MLDKIRDTTKGWFAWVIIGALAMVFTLWGVYGYMGVTAAEEQMAVTVNGADIPLNAVERLAQDMQQRAMASGQPADMAVLRQQALEELIMQTLLIQDAQKRNFVVDKKIVDRAILNQPEFQVDGKFSPAVFEQLSMQLGYTPMQLRQLMGDEIIVKQMQAGIMLSSFVLPSEVNHFLALEKQQRDLQYITFPVSTFMTDGDPDEKAIEEYYQTHIKTWETPEQVSIEYVELKGEDIAKEINVTEDQIAQVYEENKATYTKPEEREVAYILLALPEQADNATKEKVTTLANDVVKRASTGEDFAALAKEYSNDSISAENGGNLGWVNAGALSAELDQPVFAAEQGAVVGPIQTQYGLEIVKVLAVKPANVQPLSEVHNTIAAQLREQYIQNRFVELQDELATISYETPDSLTEVADILKLPLKTTELFSQQGGVDPLTQNPIVQAAAFSENVLAGENSEVLTIAPQDEIVLRIKEHTPATTLPLTVVRDQVVTAIKQAAAEQEATAKLTAWIPQLMSGEISSADVAKNVKGEWKTVAQVTRDTDAKQLPADVRDYAFALSRPRDDKTPSVGWKALSGHQYVIVQVTGMQAGAVPAADSDEWKNTQQGLTMLQQQMDYTAYLEQLRDNAEIKYH
jgi:peptidyl-prolyl cis-trans isomerase D